MPPQAGAASRRKAVWNELNWGMTARDVQSRYRIASVYRVDKGPRTLMRIPEYPLHVPSARSAGILAPRLVMVNIELLFHKDQLARITLSPAGREATADDIEALRATLLDSYGAAELGGKARGATAGNVQQWTSDATEISFETFDCFVATQPPRQARPARAQKQAPPPRRDPRGCGNYFRINYVDKDVAMDAL